MKLYKYTFLSPLHGSICCEELFPDTDGRFELSSEQMSELFDRDADLDMFLKENSEDLTSCVPEELEDVIFRAEFGDHLVGGCNLYLKTHIWVEEHLTDAGIDQIQRWITGQMSDGWGEGLEQKAWKEHRIEKPTMYFDEDTLDFEEDCEICWASYYVNPWNSQNFQVFLDSCEEVEEEVETKIVGTVTLPSYNRQVIKLQNGLALRMFLKEFGCEEEAKQIEDACRPDTCSIYLVRDLDADNGVEILPKWADEHSSSCVYNSSCTLHDWTNETDPVTRYNMPVENAVLELLK